MSLLVRKHPQDDFFIADIFDNLPFKDDIASMEHPIFTLSLKPDNRTLEYVNGLAKVKVYPSNEGLPSIMDKDFLMYCGSILVANYNEGIKDNPDYLPPKTIRVSAHDFFKATNRADNGKAYKLFAKSLVRLRGCTIETSVKTNGKKQLEGFGLIEGYRVVESCRVKNRMVALEVRFSDWYYNSIIGLEMLSINQNYFLLKKPLERRLYEIARKHCGSQKEWSISLEKLFEKSGSRDRLAKFKAAIKAIIEDNDIPDYRYSLDTKDKVTVFRINTIENHIQTRPELNLHDRAFNVMSQLKKDTLSKAKKLHEESCTDWNMQEIAVQFVQLIDKKGIPETLDGAFLGFLKKKIKTYKKDTVVC